MDSSRQSQFKGKSPKSKGTHNTRFGNTKFGGFKHGHEDDSDEENHKVKFGTGVKV